MCKIVYLKDQSIHTIENDQDALNIIEEYMGLDFMKIVSDILEEKDENESKCESCEYSSAIDRIKDIVEYI